MAWKRNAPYLILILLVSQVFAGFGCGSRQAAVIHSEPSPPVAAPGLAGGPGVTLPPPAELAPRLVAGVAATLNGAQFAATIAPSSVAAAGNLAVFTPDWDPQSTPPAVELAYALYAFDLTGQAGTGYLSWDWSVAPPASDCWVALGNQARGRWDWFNAAPYETLVCELFTDYVDGNNVLLAVVLLTGTAGGTLDWIKAETDTLIAEAWCMPNQGWAPLSVQFSPFGSSDLDGGIASYWWDMDGDGTFETDATATAGYAQHSYTVAGEYSPALQVTDVTGRVLTSATTVSVRDPAQSTVDYGTIFDDSQVRRVMIEVQQADWDEMWANIEAELEIPADVTVFGEYHGDVGLKFKGNGSLWGTGDKKPWKLDMNAYVSGQEYRNLKTLVFNNGFDDPSLCREKMGYDMLRFAGVPASCTCYAELWVDIHGDGVPAIFWGVYTMVERVDKKFIANRFGEENKGGNLYKADAWFEEGAADLVYYGENIEDYPKPRGEIAYGKETNASAADYSDIINLCRVIDGVEYPAPDDWADAVEGVLNVDGFLRYLAAMVVCDNWDIYPFSGNNYYLYNDPGSGLFQWIPWDLNCCWSGMADRPVYEHEWGGPVADAPLYDKVFEVPRYRLAYAAYIDLLRRNWFNPVQVETVAEGWHDLIRPYLIQDTGDKMYFGATASYPVAAFDANWASQYPPPPEGGRVGIVDFTGARCDYIDAHLLPDL